MGHGEWHERNVEQAGKAGESRAGRRGRAVGRQSRQAALLLGSQSWQGKCLPEPRELATDS